MQNLHDRAALGMEDTQLLLISCDLGDPTAQQDYSL